MSAVLPPEIGGVLEQLVGKVASKEAGSWVADYVTFDEVVSHGVKVSRTHIKDGDMAGLLGKLVGYHTALQTGPLSSYCALEDICACLTDELRRYLAPYIGKTLCIFGIGNADLTIDSLGPEVAKRVYPNFPAQSAFKKMTVFCPGVHGHTNIKVSAAVSSIAAMEGADCVLTIDSSCCTDYAGLCSRIQMTDTGMETYSDHERLDQTTIGKPVISIGVPTAICVGQLFPGIEDPDDRFLTVSNVSDAVKSAALVIACAILQVVYPELDYQTSKTVITEMLL